MKVVTRSKMLSSEREKAYDSSQVTELYHWIVQSQDLSGLN
jgi:hypothetical protein